MKTITKISADIEHISLSPAGKSSFWDKIAALLARFIKKLDQLATESSETDAKIRKMRAENYAKYGFYFRDRF
jgi:hypothetical protein